jgi:predicted nucleotidyltransferase
MKELDDVIAELKSHKQVSAAVLFGSHAKGKTKPLSDIDIAVFVNKPTKKTEADIGSMSSKVLDVSLFHRLPLYIQIEALKHGKPLFIRNKSHYLKIKRETIRNYLEMSHIYERIKMGVFR